MKTNRNLNLNTRSLVALMCMALILSVLQATVFSNIFAGFYTPQLLAILIVFLAFYWRSLGGALFCWIIGLILDFQIAILLGPSMIACLVSFILFSTIANNLYINSQIVLIISGAVSGFIIILGQQLVQSIFIEATSLNFISALQDACATALVTPFLFALLSRYFLTTARI